MARAPEDNGHTQAVEFNDLKSWLARHGIGEVECFVPDMAGTARGKIMPATKFNTDEGIRLPESVFIQTVTGEYPRVEGLVNPGDIDVRLRPDLPTARIVPWTDEPTGQVICDAYYADGQVVDIAPRQVLKRVLALYHMEGWQPVVAPEIEFFLIAPNTDPDYPLTPPIGRNGRPETVRQSYSIDAVNEFDPLFEDLYAYAEAQRLDVETLIHEAGAAQMEINFLHGDPLEVADQVVLFKRTVREVAMRHKIYATFMAKPMAGEPGSAMHLHQSLVDRKTGRNLFAAQESERDPRFFSYIAGLQHHMGAAMPFYAPYVNSYRRVVRGSFAPINAHWGYDNRTVGLRVPLSSPESTRIENRLAGADVNPYLAMAASLACGYLGMRDNLPATGAVQGSAYELPHQLPRNLEDALHLLQEDEDLQEILGERFVTVFCAIKASEHEAFFRVISSWEREYLLLNV